MIVGVPNIIIILTSTENSACSKCCQCIEPGIKVKEKFYLIRITFHRRDCTVDTDPFATIAKQTWNWSHSQVLHQGSQSIRIGFLRKNQQRIL